MKRVVGDILIVIRSENLEKYMVKKMEQKIIFLDIDGTLTEPGKNVVPKSALWAIAQARSQGTMCSCVQGGVMVCYCRF